jgi:cytochrome c biogenesis protein CcdA
VKQDYFGEPVARQKLFDLNARWGIPEGLQSHLVTVVGDQIVFEGHIPRAVVRDLLQWPGKLPVERLLLYQDQMGEPQSYAAWAFREPVREYDATTPIATVLEALARENPEGQPVLQSSRLLLSAVLVAGLLDGINPCAFAVLLFLIAFLFAIRKVRRDVLLVGGIFIATLYLAYFLIGVGLLAAITIPSQSHLAGRAGAYLVILLGAVNLFGAIFPRFAIQRGMPASSWERIRGLIQKATLPSAAAAGFLVGLCTLPCSGGIYVATLGLLATQTTYLKGLSYIALYNLANVTPLLVILAGLGNRAASMRIAKWERASSRRTKGIFGMIEILLGIGVLAWIL